MRLLSILLFLLISIQPLLSNDNFLLSYELVSSYSMEDLEKKWEENKIPKFIIPIENGIEVYEIIYQSTYYDGSPIKASGIYFLPKETRTNLPLLAYFHGTQIKKERDIKLGGEQAICTGFATGGYAVAYVDYFGIGKGEKFHIYQHAETEARAGLDLIRACEELNAKLDVSLNGQLFASGYSQGGHGAMSFHRYIEQHPEFGYNITASSPMSGAYDMAGAQEKAMYIEYSHPGYLPYLLIGYNMVYGFYEDVTTVMRPPYNETLPPLFDGKHSMGDVNKQMPKIPSEFITEEVIEEYQNDDNHPLKVALRENSFMDWKPEAPIQICYCNADEQVYYKNATNAYESMKELGADNVSLRRGGRKFDHNTCALYTSMYSKFFFDSIVKKGKEKGKKGPAFKRMLISISKIRFRKKIRKSKKEARKNNETYKKQSLERIEKYRKE